MEKNLHVTGVTKRKLKKNSDLTKEGGRNAETARDISRTPRAHYRAIKQTPHPKLIHSNHDEYSPLQTMSAE
jgi:hypothetical protein